MKTSSSQLHDYRQYRIAVFSLAGREFTLPVYQSQRLMGMGDYADYLFIPFTDQTTGKLSYPAGRYMDVRIPEKGNEITLDFNKSYNPFCAYSNRYSCPLVPAENHLEIEILAGVKYTSH